MEIGKQMGHSMEVMDLGGGFPQGQIPEFLIDLLHSTANLNYKIIAEPGRHFSANSC